MLKYFMFNNKNKILKYFKRCQGYFMFKNKSKRLIVKGEKEEGARAKLCERRGGSNGTIVWLDAAGSVFSPLKNSFSWLT